jgi:hypothetical protein
MSQSVTLWSKLDFNTIFTSGLTKGLSLDETTTLASLLKLFGSIQGDIRIKIVLSLQEKGLVIYNDGDKSVGVTSAGRAIFKFKQDNSDLTKTLREMFPAGLKDGKYPWRATNVHIKEKLDKFRKIYPDATDDQIVDATKNYLSRMRGDEQKMSLLTYFIMKNTDDGQKSILAEYIEVGNDLKKESHPTMGGNITQI